MPLSSSDLAPDRAVAIGDLQGCLDCLLRLLDEAGVDDATPLWLTGDLVNRGPQSLQTLRWAYRQRQRIVTVLGNHDLHLLAVACGIRRPHRSDTLDDILRAPDREELLDWLRTRPLAHRSGSWLMVHAGVLPQWDADRVIELAQEVQQALAGPRWAEFLTSMYGNRPAAWSDDLRGADRSRVIINALTRMRYCRDDGTMDLTVKESLADAPAGLVPWFDLPGRRTAGIDVVFGHWSTLGAMIRPGLACLDSGCVWGGGLTAMRLHDRSLHALACPGYASPG